MPTSTKIKKLLARVPIERTETARLKRMKKTGAFGGVWQKEPHRLRVLPDEAKLLVYTMVYGLDEDLGTIKARHPITLVDACRALGLDQTKMLQLARLPLFKDEMMELLNTRRMLEYSRNLAIAMEIRDSAGDGTPRADEVRLKAIMTIECTFKGAGGPSVQINNIQQTTEGQVNPGYIIRTAAPKTIEHEP